jgi:L-rhamnose mutarotase
MTQRVGFLLRVKPYRVDEYVLAHRDVWPEMLQALKDAGIRNYTIFRAGNEMFGYFETDDLAATEMYLSAQDANARWQDAMADFLDERVQDRGPAPLEEIFRLA